MSVHDEEALWHLIQKGNTAAFGKLYENYWETIYHTIYWRVCDDDVAKDILQDIFVSLWEKRKSILIHDTIEGYLKIMARNKVLNYFKSESTRKRHTLCANYHLSTFADTTEELLAAKEVNRHYQDAVEQLPEKMRKLYVLSREKSLSIDEISFQFSLSPQTVKNQLTAATKKIKAALTPFLPNPSPSSRRFALFFML